MSDTPSRKSVAFVAEAQIPPSPPPASNAGVIGWLRENLFQGPVNTVLTLLGVALIVWIVPAIVQWAFIDGVWVAKSLSECREINAHGACWAVIVERFDQFIYGFYPDSFPHYERWRPNLAFLLMLVAIAYLLFDKLPFRKYGLMFAPVYPAVGYWLIWGGSIWGPLLFVATALVAYLVFVLASRFLAGLFSFILAALASVFWLIVVVPAGDEAITTAIGDSRAESRVAELDTFLNSDIEAFVRDGMAAELAAIEDEDIRQKKFEGTMTEVTRLAKKERDDIVALPALKEELVERTPEVEKLRAELPAQFQEITTVQALEAFEPSPPPDMKRKIADVIAEENSLVALESRIWFTYREVGRVGLPPVESDKVGGFLLAIILGIVGIAASLPIGVLLALGRRSKMIFFQTVSIVFIEFIRGVPLITLLFVASSVLAYFFPPGSNLDKILRVVIMIVIFASAYMAEVIRGGLAALGQGQYEAADSLGLDYWKSMRLIILPQALKVSIPNIVSNFIGLFKDTTLVTVVGLLDVIGLITAIRADSAWNGIVWEFYVFAGLFFFIFCFGMSRYAMYLERKLKTDR